MSPELDLGDMRVKVFAGDSPVISDALKEMVKGVRDLTRITASEAEAESILRSLSPAQASSEFGLEGLSEELLVSVFISPK